MSHKYKLIIEVEEYTEDSSAASEIVDRLSRLKYDMSYTIHKEIGCFTTQDSVGKIKISQENCNE